MLCNVITIDNKDHYQYRFKQLMMFNEMCIRSSCTVYNYVSFFTSRFFPLKVTCMNDL